MSPRFSVPLFGWIFLYITFCTRALGGFAYERLAEFQPPAYRFQELTVGADGNAYTVSANDGTNGQRIVRIDAAGKIQTVVMFGLSTDLSEVRSWLVKGPDGSLYGCATQATPAAHRVIYRLTTAGQVEVVGDGDFTLAPVFGSDGALYGCNDAAGISRLRSNGVFETVPGSEVVRPANGALLITVTDANGVIYFSTPNKLWKIGTDGVLTEAARFDPESLTSATLGSGLNGRLVKGKSGLIYGMSTGGGPESRGVIFKVTPGGSIEPIVAFGSEPGRINGSSSRFNLVEGANGYSYHLSTQNSTSRDVFAISPAGVATKIGGIPRTIPIPEIDPLVTGSDNEAYAVYCVTNSFAVKRTVFKLSIETGCTVAGESPQANNFLGEYVTGQPIVGPDGGVWAVSSIPNQQFLYTRLIRLSPGGSFSEAELSADDVLGGRNPRDLRVLADGTIVGLAAEIPAGQATLFRILADGSVKHLAGLGQSRFAPVQFEDGSFVGATVGSSGAGSLYRLTPDGALSRESFGSPEFGVLGLGLDGPLVRGSDGNWYGLTRSLSSSDQGTIYRVTPSRQVTTVYSFPGIQDGPQKPIGPFIDGGDGALYAVVIAGGAHGFGGLISYQPGGAVTLLTSFAEPIASQTLSPHDLPPPQLTPGNGDWFYGVTNYKAPTKNDVTGIGKGFVYRVNKTGTFEVLGRFTGEAGTLPGDNPQSSLTLGADGAFYGVTEFGGTRDAGMVFRVTPAGKVQHLASFTGTAGALPGANPTASLVQRGNVLYGACAKGGAFDSGTIFRVDQNRHVAVIHTLTGASGASPGFGPNYLTTGQDGHIYGTGGFNSPDPQISPSNIHGTVFRLGITDSSAPVDDVFEVPVTKVDVLANDGFDFAESTPRVASVTKASQGVVTLNDDGTISYKPGPSFQGTDEFTYTAKAGATVLGTAKVKIVDTRPPEILTPSMNWSFAAGEDGKAALPDFRKEVVVRDALEPITAQQTPAPGTVLSIGQYQLTFRFTDRAGNSSTIVFPFTVFDKTRPIFKKTPNDQTIHLAAGAPPPLCPDLVSMVEVVDNAGTVSVSQEPPAGTPLPTGYTRFQIIASDSVNLSSYEGWIRVIPAARGAGSSGGIVLPPVFGEEHHYVSFGLPAIANDGTVAFKATIKSIRGMTKTAVFRQEPDGVVHPVTVTGDSQGFTEFGEPLVNASGTVVFMAKWKSAQGKKLKGIWAAKAWASPELIAQNGTPVPGTSSGEVFRNINDVSLLDSGAILVHASVSEGSSQATRRGLWRVADGTWQRLLRAGDALTADGKASTIRDFAYGNVLPRVGGQTRSFNASGEFALRVTLADKRSAIVRVSNSEAGVVVEPVLTAKSNGSEWLSLGIPAINDAGDIVFRGIVKAEGSNLQAVGRVEKVENVVRIIAGEEAKPALPLALIKLCDPIITLDGRVAIPLQPAAKLGPQLYLWHKNELGGGALELADTPISDSAGQGAIRYFDNLAAFDGGFISKSRFWHPEPGGPPGGIVQTDVGNLVLQAEGDQPPFVTDEGETIKRIDFLTPVLGVGGQTRSVNASGQVVFRAKLSSGKTAIYVIGN